ncbi:transmembrane protein 79 [Rhineura floridana]|uniref:transmembrane protein 79 n=1 Tax=Rhineura floridana TaxID=261503 RepID=UPI002AC893AD|nr:transmembrane protein 79 [Rhineura floridana]XP_061462800.1 transmembrane protein 79 [Rhineura floridana]XP_061462801.1 transmembrane protein 79 [Rhineura floridana]XP_061462802.1 transmembrane protein 79 [Rhineura floridana]XP_061462803.1 transmembrane protein 79 [Rhineura floridana]
MAAVIPSEEVVMVVLGKHSPERQVARSLSQEQSSEATLPWDRACHGLTCKTAMLEALGSDTRPSPEGSWGEAMVGLDADSEALLGAPASEEEEEEDSNRMPVTAAHVFVPIDPYCIDCTPVATDDRKQQPESEEEEEEEEMVRCEKNLLQLENQNFISRAYSARFDDLPSDEGKQAKTCAERLPCLQNGSCSSANLKAVASMAGATIIFPCLIYGAYVFLPFDAPLLPTMSSRLVYTLRCGVFATFPIVIGMIVYGVSRLCFSSLQPFGELRREVEIHRHYVSQSVHLFILYFFNIAVLSTYLPQEALKLIPLLTALFAISRLLYWLAYAMGRSFRGFGFGLTFLPLFTMLLFNLYSMFIMDPEDMFVMAGSGEKEQRLASKPSFWG